MHTMVLDFVGKHLRAADMPVPEPGPEQVLLRVRACGVCRTDLHIVDGELPEHKSPLIPGHQIVGVVEEAGERVERFAAGDRVGCPGSAGPMIPADTAVVDERTSVMRRASPDTM